MLSPAPMEKVRVIALKEDQLKIVSSIHEAGVVQLEQIERGSTGPFQEPSPPELQRVVADEAFRFEGLVTALPPVPVREKFELGDIEDVLKRASELKIDEQVRNLKTEFEKTDVRLARNKSYLENLGRISGFTKDLSVLTTSTLAAAFYTVSSNKLAKFREELFSASKEGIVESYSVSKGDATVLVAIPRSTEESSKPIFEKFKALKIDLPYDLGTPEQARGRLEHENSSLSAAGRRAEDALKKISEEYYGMVLAIREALNIEAQRHEAIAKLGQSDKAIVLEGWVPKSKLGVLKDSLHDAAADRLVIDEVRGSEEDAPTLMQNDSRIRQFEFLVRFFSLPKSWEIDPTLIFAIAFPLFFGLMVGDVGYGVAILLLGFYFMRVGEGRTSSRSLPKVIRSFGRGLMPKRVLGMVGKILMAGGVSSIIFGVLFNEYFGVALPWYAAVFSVVGQLPILLVITVFVGLGHVTLGYIFGVYLGVKTHHIRHAVGKIGWLIFLWSATIGLIDFFDRSLFASPALVAYGSIGGVVAAAVIMGVSEGPRFAMEIPTLMSHVMSYARILGVLLASVLLASIADTSLANSIIRAPMTATILAVAIVLMVHMLNIVLGIFEPSIQGVRLHYVEFYTKFFEGNGKRFSPFAVTKRYVK